MGLGVRYGFTQSIPGLNPWWDYISCNRTRPKVAFGTLDAPWVCDMDWDWDIKRWVLRRIVSCTFPMFCTGFLD
jgi:hypothetical protein